MPRAWAWTSSWSSTSSSRRSSGSNSANEALVETTGRPHAIASAIALSKPGVGEVHRGAVPAEQRTHLVVEHRARGSARSPDNPRLATRSSSVGAVLLVDVELGAAEIEGPRPSERVAAHGRARRSARSSRLTGVRRPTAIRSAVAGTSAGGRTEQLQVDPVPDDAHVREVEGERARRRGEDEVVAPARVEGHAPAHVAVGLPLVHAGGRSAASPATAGPGTGRPGARGRSRPPAGGSPGRPRRRSSSSRAALPTPRSTTVTLSGSSNRPTRRVSTRTPATDGIVGEAADPPDQRRADGVVLVDRLADQHRPQHRQAPRSRPRSGSSRSISGASSVVSRCRCSAVSSWAGERGGPRVQPIA